MFGVVPKSLWKTKVPADDNNLCTWALRCLLVEDGNRLMLIDTGLGDKQDDKFFGHYGLHNMQSLEQALAQKGFSPNDVTDVLLTHLHFDHCGGAVQRNSNGTLETTFKNAKYWSNEAHWNWATQPNAREKASFLKENILPIEESGQLNFIAHNDWMSEQVFPNIDILFVNGHTEAQMLPIIHYKGEKIAYVADLLPSHAHLPLAWVMGYDMRPLVSLNEKDKFLNWAIQENVKLFFEHDAQMEMCSLANTEKGVKFHEQLHLASF